MRQYALEKPPGPDGRQLRPGTPVRYTSGYTDGEILRRGLLAPGVAFVAQPFTAGALVRAVRQPIEEGGLPA